MGMGDKKQVYTRPANGREPNVRVVLPANASVRPFGYTKKNYDQLKPNESQITIDDFKCVFCFHLPQVPADERRGIVLCPKCRHPAHADEFRNWMKNSSLCSRCGYPIPEDMRHELEVIPTKEYLEIIGEFTRRAKK